MKRILPLILVLATASSALAAKPKITIAPTATGQVGVAFSYSFSADQTIISWGAAPLPAGLSVSATGPTTASITGTPAWGTDASSPYSVTLSATNGNGTGTATLTLTILPPPLSFVGFRLPDFTMSPGSPNPPRLMLQMGANGTSTTANRFNATLEVDAGGGTWVPYNHFVGITDTNPNYAFRASWITDAPLPVRDSAVLAGTPQAFSTPQLIQSPPAVYMKADPRSTRFGIFQMDLNLDTTVSRIKLSPWPSADANVQNGFGGTVATSFPGPVEHAPTRFSGAAYYPATFSINGPSDSRDTSTTIYADNDGVTRPADAIYSDGTTGTGSSTPYAASTAYRPIILNRPFQNVAELGYAFRDLPWKTLDLFSQNSADAGLLDVFCINDGPRSTTPYNANGDLGMVVPPVVAGVVNLNTRQAPVLQSVLAGANWDLTPSIVNNTGTPTDQIAPTMATNIANATSATAMKNKTVMITRAGLPTTILPTASQDNQTVKARREVVPRAISSVAQTRVWNLLIDVVAQSGRYPPGETDPKKFIVEGEQHYWVHVAIDRFTGQVIDRQVEVVKE
jgi:hypothetical protein